MTELGRPDRPLTMEDMAGVIGAFRDVEMALFSWLGRIAPTLSSADEVGWASGASLRAAWRAAQIEQLLPVSVGVPCACDTSASRRPALGACLEALEACTPPNGPGNVSGIVSHWYAALLQAYKGRLAHLSAAADGPLERVLQRLVADLEAERTAARAFRQGPG
jgi:hypothetical protein